MGFTEARKSMGWCVGAMRMGGGWGLVRRGRTLDLIGIAIGSHIQGLSRGVT